MHARTTRTTGRRTALVALVVLALMIPAPLWATDARPLVAILTYHDLSNSPDAPHLTVSPETLRTHIRDARSSGWAFLPLSEVLHKLERRQELPGRVMVLTFDDGYRSFLDHALPILRQEKVPATLAIVSSFIDAPRPDLPAVLTWNEIREIEADGLVEIAAHSHDLHRWVTSNPFRDTSPAVTTRRYLVDDARYETRDEYRSRIREDMARAQQLLRVGLGHPVSVYAWPYGEHTEMARALAVEAGFHHTLALGNRAVLPEDVDAGVLPRILVTRETRISGANLSWLEPALGEIRAAQVDLDAIHDEDPERFRRNVDAMVARVREAGATHVILQACADPKGNGMFRQAYFANHQLPVKADVWSAVAAKLHHAGLRVWVRAPVLNLAWAWQRHPGWRIKRDRKARPRHEPWYFRVSPDLPEARQAALDFYADIAVYLPIDGVLFDDDAYMLPNEMLRGRGVADPTAKSEAMREMIDEIMRTVRAWRPAARFGRNVYAGVTEHDGPHPLFAQDLEQCLRDYDLTVVMAYAHMEGHGSDPAAWVHRLVGDTLERWTGPGPAPVLFKLQAYDWAAQRWLGDDVLTRQAVEARRAGAVHLGVYPVSPRDGTLPLGLLTAGTEARSGRAALATK